MIDVYEVVGYPVSWPVETFTEGFYKSKESAEKAMNNAYVVYGGKYEFEIVVKHYMINQESKNMFDNAIEVLDKMSKEEFIEWFNSFDGTILPTEQDNNENV